MKFLPPIDRAVVQLFVLYGLALVLLILMKMPPFMGPDELNHAKRANLLTHGQLVGQRLSLGSTPESGGIEEVSLDQASRVFEPIEFHPDVKVTGAELQAASLIGWGNDSKPEGFSNTAVYPPLFYLPESLGLEIGKAASFSLLKSLSFARLLNALACLAVGTWAIAIAGKARLYLYAVLLLPMSVALSSTVTQDGMVTATAALACAFLVRALGEGRAMTKPETIGAAVSLALVGMTKPPYLLLALLLLTVGTERPTWRWTGFGCALGVPILWHIWMALAVQSPMWRPDAVIDQSGQIQFLLHHPLSVFSVASHTIRSNGTAYATQVIGVLGWLDTVLPKPYYVLAYGMLIAAAVTAYGTWGKVPSASSEGGVAFDSGRVRLARLLILGFTKLGIYAALYLAFTPVGNPVVDGVQGRYFLPLLALLPLALVGSRTPYYSSWANMPLRRRIASCLVLLFPLLSLPVVYHALRVRYYGG